MVTASLSRAVLALSGAQQAAEPLLERLDPPRRAAVVMALLGIAIIGIFLVTAVMLGGHWVRRLARHSRGPTPHTPNKANKQLRDSLEPILPEGGVAGETTIIQRKSDDTIAGS